MPRVSGSDPLPRIGPRVVLRRLRPSDLHAFQAYRGDAEVGRYQGWSVQTDQQALAFIDEMSDVVLFPRGAWVQLAVADRATDALIGDVGICVAADGVSAELGFTVAPPWQNKGLGTAALCEALGLVFTHSSAVEAVCITDARNQASIRTLERAGLRRTATRAALFCGETCVEHTYTMHEHDES